MKLSNSHISILLVCFGLYANTLFHGYVLDDKIVITENQFTKQGISGIADIMTTDAFVGFYGKEKNLVAGKRYRPLSIVTFAIEYEFFGLNAFVSHLINLLLYAITCLVLYRLMQVLLPDKRGNPWYLTTPFIITMIYLCHPLHTEVIANIKGRDEILSLLGSLASMYFLLKWLNHKELKHIVLSAVCLLLGLFAKENAITFLLIIPVTVHFFTGYSFSSNVKSWIPLFGVTVIYLAIRFYLLGVPETTEARELMNNPFLNSSVSEKYATVFYTLGLYLKLLVFPIDLTHDYYPEQIPIIGWLDYRALVPLILYLAMVAMAIIGLKTKKPTFYGMLFYLGTLSIVSNLLFPIGSFMNERFMYVPSIGYSIIMGIAFTFGIYKHISWNKTNRLVVNSLLVTLLMGYSIKTISRNKAWDSDFTLATTDVKVSSNSAKANMSAGLSLINSAQEQKNEQMKKAQLMQAVKYLQRSLEIYPTYIQPMLLMGNALFELGDYQNSLVYFENCLRLDSKYSFAINNIEHLGDKSVKNKNYGLAVKAYTLLISYVPNDFRVHLKLGQIYGRDMGDHQNALKHMLYARDLAPRNVEILDKLGIVYSIMGDHGNAIASFRSVLEIDPNNASTLLNLGITYMNMGDKLEGEELIQRAIELDPSLKR